jgi:hypothetical protein
VSDPADSYEGSCHCGAIRFSVTGPIDELADCNCSYCAKAGYLHWEVDPAQFSLKTSEGQVADYQFGTRTSHNYFCATCGTSPFRRSRSDPNAIDINVRCLDGVSFEGIPVEVFDGLHWEEQMPELATAESVGTSAGTSVETSD